MNKKVALIMGSDSDWTVMQPAAAILKRFEIPFDTDIVSAHRTPEKMMRFAQCAHEDGFGVIIAGAGGAAHLPGMTAAYTPLPVIGVPIKSRNSLAGWDSILSILQMPKGVPVATVALNAAENAGILAAQILGVSHPDIQKRLCAYKAEMETQTEAKARKHKGANPKA